MERAESLFKRDASLRAFAYVLEIKGNVFSCVDMKRMTYTPNPEMLI